MEGASADLSVEIPVNIVEEILGRLPPKSLGRFMCASKLWSSLIKETIGRRLLEEMRRRLRRLREIRPSISRLYDEMEVLLGDADTDGLRELRGRLGRKLDEMRSLTACLDDIIGWCQEEEAVADGLRDAVREMRRYVRKMRRFNWLLDVVDVLVDMADDTQEFTSMMLELLEFVEQNIA